MPPILQRPLTLAGGLAIAILLCQFIPAAEDKPDTTAKPASNPYLPPEGLSVEDLQAYLERMQDAPTSIRHRPGFAEGAAVAAQRILDTNPCGAQRTFAALALLDGLHQWADHEQAADADKRLAELSEKYATDESKAIASAAQFYLLEQRVLKSDDVPVAELPKLLDEVNASLEGKTLDERHLRIASGTVHMINRLTDDSETTKRIQQFGELFSKSDDLALSRYGSKLLHGSKNGIAEKEPSKWVGKPMELAGTTAEGAAFDITQHKGKVVLVDFWATWCPPCRASLPGLKELYEKYHARGFEIVGVDLDTDLTALSEFVEKEKLPWVNLVGEEKEGQMGFPLAEKYGIQGIPTAFLVNQEGKIVADDLRGDAVEEQVKKLLGDEEAAEKPAAK